MIDKLIGKLKNHKKELIIVAALLAISGIAQGYNMFHFPYYEDDEGAYMGQASSVLTQAKLAPYTYIYDHAPAGWFLIALWTKLTGGFFTFGVSVNSGRVLMLLLHLATAALIFYIAKRLTKGLLAGTVAVLIFSLSPLAIYFQRRVLLDNMMIFWVLLSFAILIKERQKLSSILLSAITFSIAVLTKESAVFFTPVFIYLVVSRSHSHHKNFALAKWLAIFTSLVSFYFLFAMLKGELFPTGTLLGGNQPHVSLIETIQNQMARKGGFFLNPGSSFMLNFREWLRGGFFVIVPDPGIIMFGVFSTIAVFFLSFKHTIYRYLSFLTFLYWAFLIRGGEVIGFYIIPLVPLLALNIGITIDHFSGVVSKKSIKKIIKPVFLGILLAPFAWYYSTHLDIYTKDQTSNQIKAMEWISKNVPENSIILIDDYAFVDLRNRTEKNISIKENAHFYWKADKDREITIDLLKNDWRNIDYLLVTPQMKFDIYHNDLGLVREAYENSILLTEYTGAGWDVEVRKVIDDRGAVVQSDRESGVLDYTVSQGDNLWTIAKTKLGEPRDWTEIADLNDISAPYIVHPGDKIRLRVY